MPEAPRAALYALLAVALPALPLVANLPSRPRMLGVLNDAAHGPVFGAFAVVVLVLLKRVSDLSPGRRYFAAFALALLVGGAVELIQPMIGRASEWSDLLNDGLGAIAGLAAAGWFEFGKATRIQRSLFAATLVVALTAVLYPVAEAALGYAWRAARFPILFQASTTFDRYFLGRRGTTVSAQRLPARWHRAGDPLSLQVRALNERWPGISLLEPQPDWSAHQTLMLDITNPETEPLTVTIRVHDRGHNNQIADRYGRQFTLAPSQRHVIAIPLDEIARGPASRRLDLSHVAGLILFVDPKPDQTGHTFYLTQVWLE